MDVSLSLGSYCSRSRSGTGNADSGNRGMPGKAKAANNV